MTPNEHMLEKGKLYRYINGALCEFVENGDRGEVWSPVTVRSYSMPKEPADIVERLQAGAVMKADCHWEVDEPQTDALCYEAAAEIERLRAVIASHDRWVPKPASLAGGFIVGKEP